MIYVAGALAVALAALVLAHFVLAGKVVWMLWRWRRTLLSDAECPKAVAVLCLRGPDPFLEQTMEGILHQDYPPYDIHIVVDHPDDPSREVVEAVVRRQGAQNVVIEPLTDRRDTCSLKCSSVVQAVSKLKDTHDIVAFFDADTIPHREWLRELATAVSDKGVGAVTGNRWFMPAKADWGALVRYLWNAPAMAQTVFYRLAWGGAMAIRTSVFRETNLLEKWSKAFCEDTMLYQHMKENGLEFRPAPAVLMPNRETTTMEGFYHFARRQLLCVRLYHPIFWMVVVHCLCVTLLPFATLIALVVSLILGDVVAATACAGGLAFYLLSLTMLLGWLEVAARRIVHARGQPTGWWTITVLTRLLPAFIIAHYWNAAAMVSALTSRTVQWRKVTYEINAPWDIRMLDYQPFQIGQAAETHGSL